MATKVCATRASGVRSALAVVVDARAAVELTRDGLSSRQREREQAIASRGTLTRRSRGAGACRQLADTAAPRRCAVRAQSGSDAVRAAVTPPRAARASESPPASEALHAHTPHHRPPAPHAGAARSAAESISPRYGNILLRVTTIDLSFRGATAQPLSGPLPPLRGCSRETATDLQPAATRRHPSLPSHAAPGRPIRGSA